MPLLKFIGQYLENEIRYQQVLCNFWSAWSNDSPKRISTESDLRPRRRRQKRVLADLMGSIGKIVESDRKNIYTKFCVNRIYGVGVRNFKVKKMFFFNFSAPIKPIGVKLLGQCLHTTSKQDAKFHVCTIYHLTGICKIISEGKE